MGYDWLKLSSKFTVCELEKTGKPPLTNRYIDCKWAMFSRYVKLPGVTLTGLLVFIIANQLGFDGIWNGIFPWLELEKPFFMVDLPIIYQATEEDH